MEIKKPRFEKGDTVIISSKTSKHTGSKGVIVHYCKGAYANICKVSIDGLLIHYVDTSLELVESYVPKIITKDKDLGESAIVGISREEHEKVHRKSVIKIK